MKAPQQRQRLQSGLAESFGETAESEAAVGIAEIVERRLEVPKKLQKDVEEYSSSKCTFT